MVSIYTYHHLNITGCTVKMSSLALVLSIFLTIIGCLSSQSIPDNLYKDGLGTLRPFRGKFPSKRAFHCLASHNSLLILFGGLDEGGNYLNDIHFFDTRTHKWSGAVDRVYWKESDVVENSFISPPLPVFRFFVHLIFFKSQYFSILIITHIKSINREHIILVR